MSSILVTGGAGYIGSHCIIALLKQGYDVIIFDNLETGHLEIVNKLKSLVLNGHIIDFIKGDLKDFNSINYVFERHRIDCVMHFAAYSQIEESVKNQKKYYSNNILGTLNLLNSMVKNGVNNIIFSSSAAIYGIPKYTPIDECHPKNPINPYGITKLFIENLLNGYDKAYNLKSISLRYFNVIGANPGGLTGEWHNFESHLVPNILKSAIDDKNIFKIYGSDYKTKDGTCIRDFVDVEDIANAHLLALLYLKDKRKSDCFNLGSNEGYSVKEVLKACENATKKKIPIYVKSKRLGDPEILVADNKKAKSILKWHPTVTLKNSIYNAYTWENNRQIV